MFPFSGFGPINRTERKALLYAGLFSCLFIFLLAIARPHPRSITVSENRLLVDPVNVPYKLPLTDLSSGDSLERFRVRPEHFEQIDFRNHSYGPYRSPDGTKLYLNLEQGEYQLPNHSGWFALKDVYYTDMTGDGKEEAIVWLYHVKCGAGCDGGANAFLIYSERNGKLIPIWQYETGSYETGCGLQSFTAGGTQVVVELFGRCPDFGHRPSPTKFIVKDLTFIVFEFDGRRFAQKSIEYFDSSSTDVKNYEPGIRIY
jgi:hypothetical protein